MAPTFVPESPAFAQEYRIGTAGLVGEYTNVRIPALAKVLFACVLALGTLLVSAQTSDCDQPYRPQVQQQDCPFPRNWESGFCHGENLAPSLDLGVKRIISSVRRRFRAGGRTKQYRYQICGPCQVGPVRLSQFTREANQDAGTSHVVVDKAINISVRGRAVRRGSSKFTRTTREPGSALTGATELYL